MNNIIIYLKLLSRKFDSDNMALYHDCDSRQVCQIDKSLYDEYGKERLWLYNLDNGYIEKYVWDGVRGCYVQQLDR